MIRRLAALVFGLVAATSPALAPSPAYAGDKVVFGTNWLAQAEHGGFYQAVADGTYAKYGLDVEIRMGGPQVNHSLLLAAGKIDFNMGGESYGALNYVENNIPVRAVASMFQKEPRVMIAHPDTGVTDLKSLKGRPILLSKDALQTYWLWMKRTQGLTDDQIRPYNFSPAPFLADKMMIMQGYLSSEPYTVKQAGIEPVVLLLADYGDNTYSTLIEAKQDLIDKNPDLVQRFIDATIIGWKTYLHGDASAANALIKAANPEMTDDQIAYAIKVMNDYGIVESGDALTLGIGAMTDARWKSFFDGTVAAGIYPADLDLKKAYSLQFVNKGVGLH
ncbi:ABC transporter substrate-binding protein [Zavarzinia aquatilis]|uniref:Nitrate ABC transporter substrate-binding protein n=1 Tax=Zavarzinia aquatilis TaxID=2211142 RepID=A0A317E668_9PROT|nr:ABC transporter substrate-binding protein [Zavarzinia aquatilis]PWR22598.1 nitrate ABC transporter substrate-binding protein [Zavarzinia aquatilis]